MSYFSAIEPPEIAPSGLRFLMVPVMLIPSLKSPPFANLRSSMFLLLCAKYGFKGNFPTSYFRGWTMGWTL